MTTLGLQTLRHRLPKHSLTAVSNSPTCSKFPAAAPSHCHWTGTQVRHNVLSNNDNTQNMIKHINPILVISKLIEHWRNRGKHTQTQAGETRTTSYKITYHYSPWLPPHDSVSQLWYSNSRPGCFQLYPVTHSYHIHCYFTSCTNKGNLSSACPIS